MKELLIGMGLGFIIGSVLVKTNKCYSNTVEKGVEKGKEIIEDIKDEVQQKAKQEKKGKSDKK